MKQSLLALLILLLLSCADTKEKASGLNESATVESSKGRTQGEGTVPILSFEELQPMLQRQNDTTYVVNFWATWCRPCIKELPYFEQLGAEYANKKVKVLLVSLDFPDKLENQVIPFIEKNKLQSKVVLLDDPDANTWIPKVSQAWSGAIPATVIYNSEQRSFFEKSFTYEELEQAITTILK